jgi:hypothetical protein
MQRFCALLALPMLALASTGTTTHTFEFAPADFVFDRVNGFDVVALPGQYTTSEPGQPCLPLAVYNIVIPPDAEVVGVRVTDISTEDLRGEFDIHPCQRPYAFSKGQADFVEPDPSVYASNTQYPREVASHTRSGSMGGFRLAGIRIFPLVYFPASRKLQLATRLAVEVSIERDVHTPCELDLSQVELMADVVGQTVANPEDIARFAPRTVLTDDWLCDMAIITSSSLASDWQTYADYKTRHGINTKVVTTDSIYSNCPGRDNQEKIRNCVIDYWQLHGLKWLLLGGDEPVVPVREGRIICEGSTGNIATDLYYADLQYSWDSNNNNLFGEMEDSMDLFYDIFVGRAPVDGADQISNFVAKCTTYSEDPDTAYLKSVLFGSTMLFNPFHGRVINRIIADEFPPGWRFAHLEDPPSGAFRDSMSAGYQLGHVAAHGSQTSFSVMSISQVSGLTNGHRKLNFTNSIACNSGWFDGYECIAESLFNCRSGGCIATMFNSRYGYGYPPGFGPSEMLDLEFYRYLIKEAGHQFGTLATLCKDHFQSLTMGQEVWRWCVYELNLFGDPSLQVWFERPQQLAVQAPSSVMTGPQVVRVRVTDSYSPVPDARVCLMKGDETYARGWTNSQGWVELLISPTTAGNIDITVNAHNFYPHEATITVTGSTSGPALVFGGLRIDDADANGRLDPGETADLYLKLANLGASQATSTSAKLRTTCPYLTLSDSTSSFGNIAARDTVEGDAFTVTAQVSTPTGTIAELFFPATASEGNWEAFTTTRIGDMPPPKRLWLDHDTGEVIMSVTTMGSIGTLGPWREGTGLKYPRDAGYGSLYFTSLACANGPDYVVDRWYSQPASSWDTDWRATDTLHPLIPPRAADEEYGCVIDDANHPTPKGLTVSQWSGASWDPRYRDFVVIQYVLTNRGTDPINDLYVGILSDFDVDNQRTNRVYSDTARRLTYMTRSSGFSPTIGIKLLEPATAANLSAIDSAIYRGSGMMTEAAKDSFLNGSISDPNPSTAKNWSCVVSAGPIGLPVNGRVRVAFAFVGAESEEDILTHADSAQSWYEEYMPEGVNYYRHFATDSPPGGNDDGDINPGEDVRVFTWVRNFGETATGVTGKLTTTAPGVTVFDSIVSYGDIAADDTACSQTGFGVRLDPDLGDELEIPCLLECRDDNDSAWTSQLTLLARAPQFGFVDVLIHDSLATWPNGRLDGGEVVELEMSIANLGTGNSFEASAVLRSTDTMFSVIDSFATFGTLFSGDTVACTERFVVRGNEFLPPGTELTADLRVLWDHGNDTTFAISFNCGGIVASDPVPDSGPLAPWYFAYDDGDTFYTEAPVYEWIEIHDIGTRLELDDQQTVHVSLPPEFGPFKFYGQSFDTISVCSNGWIAPGVTNDRSWQNRALPTNRNRAILAVCWDDLYPPYGNGVWYYHDQAHNRFIVEYDSVHYSWARDEWDKFQVIIYDTTLAAEDGNSVFLYQYYTANNYVSITVGEQDGADDPTGIGLLCDGGYHPGCIPLAPGRAIKFTTDHVMMAVAEGEARTPVDHELLAVPNPVRDWARISFGLPVPGRTRLTVHDITGREVRTLADAVLPEGRYTFGWNRRDESGREVAAGVYFYKLETPSGSLARRAVVVR